MAEKKIVSIDLDAAKSKATKTAKTAAASLSEKVRDVRATAREKAIVHRDKAVALMLAKGIELSKKQLAALEKLRKKLR